MTNLRHGTELTGMDSVVDPVSRIKQTSLKISSYGIIGRTEGKNRCNTTKRENQNHDPNWRNTFGPFSSFYSSTHNISILLSLTAL